jgi:phospholipase C
VPCPNISDYRRATVGDLTAAFQGHARREPPVYEDTTGQLGFIDYTIANFSLPTAPGATQTVPVQEPGRRPHVG